MLRAVLFDVDFTIARPGPELGPEGYRRLDLEALEHGAEDRRMGLRPAERSRADRRVDPQAVMGNEGLEVAARVRDEP